MVWTSPLRPSHTHTHTYYIYLMYTCMRVCFGSFAGSWQNTKCAPVPLQLDLLRYYNKDDSLRGQFLKYSCELLAKTGMDTRATQIDIVNRSNVYNEQ